MNMIKSLAIPALCAFLMTPAFADVEPADFVDTASALGLAEIENGKLALEKGESSQVRAFAQTMIDDHTKSNQELAEIATRKNLEVADGPTLMASAKKMILNLRDGESFDEAYANNQVKAHEQTIELYRKQVREGKDADLKSFAEKSLPQLEEHLKMARELSTEHATH